jgi:hypothetical protein
MLLGKEKRDGCERAFGRWLRMDACLMGMTTNVVARFPGMMAGGRTGLHLETFAL